MPSQKLKLLVVDDEKDICNFIELLFKKKGFTVYTALSGTEAVATAGRVKPDIVLLDIYLKKGMDGIETLREIRKISPNSRCVIVTWDASQEKVKEAQTLGASSYLTKPLTIPQLLKAVETLSKKIEREVK